MDSRIIGARAALAKAAAALCMCVASAGALAAPFSYVGSFNVFDGAWVDTMPGAVSARQAAALIYGGLYSDYAISTLDSRDWSTVTRTAWVDGFFDPQYLSTPVAEDFYAGDADGLYNDLGHYSAFVCDHAECEGAGFERSAGIPGLNYTNYVWRINQVPEPVGAGLVLAALGALWAVRRRARPGA